MAQNVQSLWSPSIKATVMSPLAILRGQAEALLLLTGGVLMAQIVEETQEGRVSLSLDLVAPALQGSRHRILKVIHDYDRPYPAQLQAEIFNSSLAFTDEEFTEKVAQVLRSTEVSSVAQSLIARANEALAAEAPVQ